MDYIEKFKELSQNTMHGNGEYFTHCITVHNILKEFGADSDICKAGLYHSIYGNDYFEGKSNLSRQEIQHIIGTIAEDLVFRFCHMRSRFMSILTNSFKVNPYIDKALTQIEYANLKEQYARTQDTNLLQMCESLMHKLTLFSADYEHHIIDQRELYIFDNLFDQSALEFINQYCLNSVYKPEHSSNNMNYEIDSRFVSMISASELQHSTILPVIRSISNYINKDLYIGNQYINHYTLNTSVSEHCDGSEPGQYTILVFPNKYWESTWGGEIAFYDTGSVHKLINFKPGRVILFDSRISHKVMPLTRNARRDRYSIAIKCCDETGLEHFNKIYTVHTKVEKNV